MRCSRLAVLCLAPALLILSACSNKNKTVSADSDSVSVDTPTSSEQAADSSTIAETPVISQQSEPSVVQTNVKTQPDTKGQQAALAFASDISSNNPQVIERVNAAFDNPRRDPEVVGFYLDEDVSDFEVAFRTAITALNDGNYVMAFENKFSNELLSSLLSNKSIFPNGVEVNQQIGQYIEQLAYGIELGPDDFELDEPIFAQAVQAIEENAKSNGVYFLELNLGSSDTRFIIPTNQTNYERWLNVAFDRELAVEQLTWANIWDDIAYNIYDTDTYNLPGILSYEKPLYRNARDLIKP